MYNKEFQEIYQAVDKIYEMADFNGWCELADDITNKIKQLESLIKAITNINLNNEVHFKPTELGLSIIKNNTYFSPKENIDDVIKTLYQYDGTYMTTELWDFMNLFGKYFEHGLNVDESPCDINFEIIKE